MTFKHSSLSSITKRNIYGLYLISFLNGLLLWYAIEQLFIEDLGGGVLEKGLSVGMYVAVFSLVNIPIGAFADKYGRKLSLVLGLVAFLIGLYLMAISSGIYFYIFMNIPIAFSVAFFDGATESMVYDSLADDGHEKSYSKVLGNLEASLFIGLMLANIASGFVADALGLQANYFLSLIPVSIGLLVAIFVLKEPEHHKDLSQKVSKKIKLAIHEVLSNKYLLYIFVAIVALYTVNDLTEEFSQPLFTSLSNSAVGLSLFWAVVAASAAFGQLIAHRFKKYLQFAIIAISVITLLLLVVSDWLAIAVLPFFFIVAQVGLNGLEVELQDNSKSHLRSTISSIYGTAIALLLIPALIIGGYLGDIIKVNVAVSIIALPLCAICIVYYGKYTSLKK